MSHSAAHGDGDQLELDLFPGEPWSGLSPRVLTRGNKLLYLRPEPPGHEVACDPAQLELWPIHRPSRKKGHYRRTSVMAPLLLPL